MKRKADTEAALHDLGIDDAEVTRRKKYLDLTERDVARLVAFHRRIEESRECAFFVEAFYRHLQSFPETARFIEDPVTLARLKKAQAEYFHTLTAGDYGHAYIRDRLRVGLAHERIGLEPKWYLGAYNLYLFQLVPKVQEYFGHDLRAATETLQALVKIIVFDMGLAIDTYIYAVQRAIRRTTERLAALNQVAIAITSSSSLNDILNEIMRSGIQLTAARAACIAFYDQGAGRFKEWVTQGLRSTSCGT